MSEASFVDWFFWIALAIFISQVIRFFAEPSEADHQIKLKMKQAEDRMKNEEPPITPTSGDWR